MSSFKIVITDAADGKVSCGVISDGKLDYNTPAGILVMGVIEYLQAVQENLCHETPIKSTPKTVQ